MPALRSPRRNNSKLRGPHGKMMPLYLGKNWSRNSLIILSATQILRCIIPEDLITICSSWYTFLPQTTAQSILSTMGVTKLFALILLFRLALANEGDSNRKVNQKQTIEAIIWWYVCLWFSWLNFILTENLQHYIVYMGDHSFNDSESVIAANHDILASVMGRYVSFWWNTYLTDIDKRQLQLHKR